MTGLKLEQISHRFGDKLVVDDLSLSVGEGEIVCLLGPSGCGKTTTLRIAAGLEPLQAGRVSIGGRLMAEPGRDVPTEHRKIGLVFQDYALFPHLTVRGNVEFGLRKKDAATRKALSMPLLRRLGIEQHASAYPHVLSGGEQQRVALARALIAEPRVMLMDEPFANLDSRLRDRVRDDTLRLLREEGSATLLVTHDPEEAMLMADRVALMRQGKVIQAGRPEDLYDRPNCRFVAEFFGDMNVFAGTIVGAGEVVSPLGMVSAKETGIAEGRQVEVLVRPEAVRLSANGSGTAAVTLNARAVGGYALADFQLVESGVKVRARFPGRSGLCEGDPVNLEADPAQIFVFSTENA